MTVKLEDLVRLHDTMATPMPLVWAIGERTYRHIVRMRRGRKLRNGRRVAFRHQMRARRLAAKRPLFVPLTPKNWPPPLLFQRT